jgi:hypothetical protein
LDFVLTRVGPILLIAYKAQQNSSRNNDQQPHDDTQYNENHRDDAIIEERPFWHPPSVLVWVLRLGRTHLRDFSFV